MKKMARANSKIHVTDISADVKKLLKEYCEKNELTMYKFVSQEILKAIESDDIDREEKKWKKQPEISIHQSA